jgi:competence protein ComEC
MIKLQLFLIQIIAILLFSAILDFAHFKNQQFFQLKFLDIGQGDATLLRTPTNCTILIDGGPPQALLQKMKDLLPMLETKIDLVILTHPHLDHLAGLLELEKKYEFSNVFLTGVNYGLAEYDQFLSQLDPSAVTYITKPQQYTLCGVQITLLSPVSSLYGQDLDNINNSSIITLLDFAGQKILIPGDAELEQEHELLSFYSSLPKIDILKAGHHGSRTSTSIDLLNATKPDKLIISSGKGNSYGHPHSETLKKANQFKIQVFRTDQLSDVIFFF